MLPLLKNIGECIQTQRKDFKIQTKEYLPMGEIPVIDQGADLIAGYIDNPSRAYSGPLPVIVFGDHTCCLKYIPFQFAVGADGTQLIRPSSDFNVRFFYYALCALNMEHFGYQRHFKLLKTKEVAWFPLSTQRKIAAILSAYDDLIENNLRRIRILEEMAQNLYREWFVHFRFPGHEKVKMVDSPLGQIPEGWTTAKLSDVVDGIRDIVNPGEHLSGRHYVPIDCLPRKSFALLEDNAWQDAQSSLQTFENDDILFGAMRPYFHKVVIAPFQGITRSTCFVLRPRRQADLSYALLTVFQEESVKFANAHSRGTTIPYAVWEGSMAEMPVILPPPSLRQSFNAVVHPMLKFIQSVFSRQLTLRRTRDLLLPRLISGEVDVSDLDITIPEEPE